MSKYLKFDRRLIQYGNLQQRESKVTVHDIIDPAQWLQQHPDDPMDAEIDGLADAIADAKIRGAPIIWFISGHVVKHGLSLFMTQLMDQGYCTHLACNGSVLIHEYELLTHGETSEDVGRYIKYGQFGNWRQTGYGMHAIINKPYISELGLGERFGLWTTERKLTPKWSLLHQSYVRGIPMTAHVLMGGDIIHQHRDCDGANLGLATYNDFLIFTQSVHDMVGGVFINVGSQVTGTEVFLKALSMARNVRYHAGDNMPLHNITTGMLDFVALPSNWRDGEASEGEAAYYYRPYKSLLLRTVADGGKSFYVGGPHVATLPNLWRKLVT